MRKFLEKLPKEIRELVYLAKDEATYRRMPAYLVGGFVRDLILGVRNFDLDIVVVGDGIKFAEYFAGSLKAKLIRHKRFGTATVLLKSGLKIDIATARSEIYPLPAHLPVVKPGSLEDDLFRRDFTINAMAISLAEKDFGRLIDCYGGIGDLKNKTISVLHALSFIDDPTRILRAVRFEKRYSFHLESKTLRLLKEAGRRKMLEQVEPQRLRDELILILKEAQPLKQMQRVQELAGLKFIWNNLTLSTNSKKTFRAIAAELRWFKKAHTRRRQLDFWLIYFMSMLDILSLRSVKLICKKFVFSRGEIKRIISYRKIGQPFIARLSQKKIRPAGIFDLLEPLSYEVILLLKAKYKNPVFQGHIKDFLQSYNGMRLHIRGHDLVGLGLQPGPDYQRIFRKVLKAKLNGLVHTQEEEIALTKKLMRIR